MADDHIYLVHKRSCLAICLARMLGNDWHGTTVTERWNDLVDFLHHDDSRRDVWWKSYLSKQDEFLLVQDTSFNKTWTTPSGSLVSKADRVVEGLSIFRVKLL